MLPETAITSRFIHGSGIFALKDGISGRFCYFCSLKTGDRDQDTSIKVQESRTKD